MLSLLVMSAVFVCQIGGSVCPMMAPTAGIEMIAGAALLHAHTEHSAHRMTGGRMCPESLPSWSSSQFVESPVLHEVGMLDASWVIEVPTTLGKDHLHNSSPIRSGPALYTHLCTFRI